MIKKKPGKILVAMSGGVDSSVAAALLVKDGYDVTGAYMKQWDDSDKTGVCTWKQDRRDALRVAAHLGIPLLTLDFEKEYKEWVMSYMFAEYEKGRTPNPDVLCNKFIKFGVWLKKARELGFDKLATGHYAKIKLTINNKQLTKSKRLLVANCSLLIPKDKDKDQTYFLHQLSQEQLVYTLFPIGDYTKKEVRKMALKFGLPTAERAESMGICFIGEVPMKEFLLKKIKPRPGAIVTSDGRKIGEHDGLPFYTIGQRHLKMQNAECRMQNGETKALYVVGKNFLKNELVVGTEENPLLYKKEIELADVNWIGQTPKFPLKCEVRLRHRQEMQNAECRMRNGVLKVYFKKPQKAVTPGQFAVIYGKGECLGGGVII